MRRSAPFRAVPFWGRLALRIQDIIRDSNFWKRVGLSTLLAALVVGVAQAVGRDVYALWLRPFFFEVVLPFLQQSYSLPTWPLMVAALLFVITLIYAVAVSASRSEDSQVTIAMLQASEKATVPLIQALELSNTAPESDQLIQRLTSLTIRVIMTLYSDKVSRALVLVPDKLDPDNWLFVYSDIGLDDLSRTRRFYIGQSPDEEVNRPGVAGAAYRVRKPQLVHFNPRTKKADNPEYIHFHDEDLRPYKSFVAVPLFASFLSLEEEADGDNRVYGVICLDSGDTGTFDRDPIKDPPQRSDGRDDTAVPRTVIGAGPLLRVIYHLLRWRAHILHI